VFGLHLKTFGGKEEVKKEGMKETFTFLILTFIYFDN